METIDYVDVKPVPKWAEAAMEELVRLCPLAGRYHPPDFKDFRSGIPPAFRSGPMMRLGGDYSEWRISNGSQGMALAVAAQLRSIGIECRITRSSPDCRITRSSPDSRWDVYLTVPSWLVGINDLSAPQEG